MASFSSKALEEIKTMREAGFTEKQIHSAIDSYLKQLDEDKEKAEKERKVERELLEKETMAAFKKIYKFYGIDAVTKDDDIKRAVRNLFNELEILSKF